LREHNQLWIDSDTDVPKVLSEITGQRASVVAISGKTPELMIAAGYRSIRFPVDESIYTVVYDPAIIEIQERKQNGKKSLKGGEEQEQKTKKEEAE